MGQAPFCAFWPISAPDSLSDRFLLTDSIYQLLDDIELTTSFCSKPEISQIQDPLIYIIIYKNQ